MINSIYIVWQANALLDSIAIFTITPLIQYRLIWISGNVPPGLLITRKYNSAWADNRFFRTPN